MRNTAIERVAGLTVVMAGLFFASDARATPIVDVIAAQIAQANTDLADQQDVLAELHKQISEQRTLSARLRRAVARDKRSEAASAIPKVEGRLAALEIERAEVLQVIADLEQQIKWLHGQLELWQPSGSDES